MNHDTVTAPGKFVVGGHSFIPELGHDPPIHFEEQLALVNACLDAGITAFDTTYEPERTALGRILDELGRRREAQIIAWNFFAEIEGRYIVPPRPFQPSDIDLPCEGLRTEYIDFVVVHPVSDAAANHRQTEVAIAWQKAGRIGALGTWAPGAEPVAKFGRENPYSFMVTPCNLSNPNTDSFRAAKEIGWRTVATSPFNRGWLLENLTKAAARHAPAEYATMSERVADALLRFTLFSDNVDTVIVGIRRREWIARNLMSFQKGPLTNKEHEWLYALKAEAEAITALRESPNK
jgi:aryl-alcohol dehydrogenase-like predicted oxidoreductase